jgi:alkylation response protein AidB-like acyl-CoA dehydrogenase
MKRAIRSLARALVLAAAAWLAFACGGDDFGVDAFGKSFRIGANPAEITIAAGGTASATLESTCIFNSQQKARFLPRIREGDDFWVQGYSEPSAGSDLAALKTRADRVSSNSGDHYLVNGQKIWTTLGHYGDWIFCLVRTDFTAEKRQEGISFLLIVATPGITVRPLILMDGGHEVNEVFFDDVKVPAENLVFEENKGWTVAKYLLGHERMGSGAVGAAKREVTALRALAARFRDRLSRAEIELQALEITSMRFLDQMRRTGQPPGADVSMLKIRATEIQQVITELMMQAVGPLAAPFKGVEGGEVDAFTSRLTPRYCNFRKASIYAGSNEIQRNIIAKMTLGLPA